MPSVQRARAQSARPWVAAPETASPGLTVFSFATLPLILAAASLREFDSGDIERVLHVVGAQDLDVLRKPCTS